MNKWGVIVTVILFVIGACDSNKSKEVTVDNINNPATASGEEDTNIPILEFEETVINFGEIQQGDKVTRNFSFTNTGKADLIISSAKGSCGCTVPEWPEKPVAPGDKGEITVVFNSTGKYGQQNKTITILANTSPATSIIALKGTILTNEEDK